MSVGGIKGGGGKKGAGGAGGAKGAGGAQKTSGSDFDRRVERKEAVDGTPNLSGVHGAAGSQGAEPVLTARAMAIAQGLKQGEIKSKQEATRRFVDDILKEKLKLSNKSLSEKIADSLNDDPRLSQMLDKLWTQGT